MTIKDIAKLANCSPSTVSRVINNQRGVSDGVRSYIKQIIEENHFQLNKTARNLVKGRQNTVLFFYDNQAGNPYFQELIRGVIDGAEKYHQTMLFNTITDSYIIDYFVKMVEKNQIDGAILAVGNRRQDMKPLAYRLKEHNVPVVLVDDPLDIASISSVRVDGESAAYQATNYLINQGHKKIAHIGGRVSSYTGSTRYEGYLRAMQTHGLAEYAETAALMNNLTREDAVRSMTVLLEREDRPTAVFVCNDNMALGVYEAVKMKNLKIPEDVSVIGYDDIEQAKTMDPPLTTVRQPIYEIGMASVKMITEIVEEGENSMSHSLTLLIELMIRDSVSVPKISY